LAIKCIENKKHLFAMKLDAVKAFDRLWRDAVFLKVKIKVNFLSMVILLKIYYDQLQGRVKIKRCLSKIFKLKNGVKQSGVLSGDLYNCLIDDLIIECYNSGFGATFIDIILCILGFCDDLCLFSCSEEEMKQLLSFVNDLLENGELNLILQNVILSYLVHVNMITQYFY